jgi:nicotinate-nucleotide pyrophosphorylase (carboxylating)
MARDFQQIEWGAVTEDDCRRIIRAAVLEDLDRGYDWTTVALVPAEATGVAAVVARSDGVLAGLPAAALVIDEMDKSLAFTPQVADGASVVAQQTVATVSGSVRSLLAAERLILNLLSRLSGIATLTSSYVKAAAGTKARIYDTRKTTPGWRHLEKYAVRQGGGRNHRTGLYDAILIKDNHLAFAARMASEDRNPKTPVPNNNDDRESPSVAAAADAVRKARAFIENAFRGDPRAAMIVEIEVDSLAQLEAVLAERPDVVLLDNMSPFQLQQAVELRNRLAPAVELEASGGINLQSIRAIAEAGVDRISIGGLTHSAPALDIGLDWLP